MSAERKSLQSKPDSEVVATGMGIEVRSQASGEADRLTRPPSQEANR